MARSSELSFLPIDEKIVEVLHHLRNAPTVVVEAPPGAGKTTRLPYALLSEPWCQGSVIVSEPRRIAARLAATYVAEERGEKLGAKVGYQVRLDDKSGPNTRLFYVTEGILLRRLLAPNGFSGLSAIVIDEVHERGADVDVLLALLKRRQAVNKDLRVVLMSATLDARALGDYLQAPLVRSEGRSYPVDVSHLPKEDTRPLPIQIRSAVKEASEHDGDILVFLPGAAEIRQAAEALEAMPAFETLVLHGDLPVDQQVKVMRPGNGRRVVLSTNVAESSVTIPGVTTVIDSGLARTAVFDPWSGVTRLKTCPISQARCIQRAGRAGRVAPGRAMRLFTKGDFGARPAQDVPEIQRGDLSSILLMLHGSGLKPSELPWLSPPSTEAWLQAEELLRRLGATSETGLTEVGKAMSRLPLSARLGRVAVAGFQLGCAHEVTQAVALLAERDIVERPRHGRPSHLDVVVGDSDLEDRLDRLTQLEQSRFDRRLARSLRVDAQVARRVSDASRSLFKTLPQACKGLPQKDEAEPVLRALLTGFPDRVAERRTGRDLILENGTQATLDPLSCVTAPLLLALSADAPGGRHRKATVRLAARLEPDFLLDAATDAVSASESYVFHPEKEWVEVISRLTLGKVTLDESRGIAPPSEETARVLTEAALAKGPRTFDPEGELERLYVRLGLLFTYRTELFEPTNDELEPLRAAGALLEEGPSEEGLVRAALRAAAATRVSLTALREAVLADELTYLFPSALQTALRDLVPLETKLKGGRRLRIHYEKGKSPWIESRLQDFFGMTEGPQILGGRLPLQLHFLAPNHRALQVTTDLAGFWQRHYPDLRRQLMRRYPKHLWPEDGRTARPPEPGRIR